MDYIDKVKKAVKLEKQSDELRKEANTLLGGGPKSYYMDQLIECTEEFFKRCCPHDIGDVVCLTKAPKCEGGWKGCGHFLKKGAPGEIYGRSFRKGRFYFDVIFYGESYISSSSGEETYVKPENRHTFHLPEDFLVNPC